MKRYPSFADLIIEDILESERYTEIVCTGCKYGELPEGCPFDGDFYDENCPSRHEVHNMEVAVRATLNCYGIE